MLKFTKDDIISGYFIHIATTSGYLASVVFVDLTPFVAISVVDILLAYYVFDIHLMWFTKSPELKLYGAHHIIAMSILAGYKTNTLPISVGMPFLTLVECSNVFLQWYQLASKKQWHTIKAIVSIPFLLTYVPLRGVAIPICSMFFLPHLAHLNLFSMLYYAFTILFVDFFSMYYAWYVCHKFLAYWREGKRVKST